MYHVISRFNKYISFVVIGIFVLSFSTSSPTQANPDDFQVLKEQIKKELYAEIRQELYAEFEQNIHTLVENEVRKELEAFLAHRNLAFNADSNNNIRPKADETLEQAVQRTVREVFASGDFVKYVPDEELEKIVAGRGIEPQLDINYGIKKNPHSAIYQLAKATAPSARPMVQEEYEVVAGEGEEERAESIERTLQQRGSILLPKGTLIYEPSFSWSHFSSNRINIQGFSILPVLVIGDISIQQTKRDIVIQNNAFKYGLINNLQAELKIPMRAQYSRDTISESNETTRNAAGIGDIEFGLSRQIGWEGGIMPDLIAAVNVKTPTGRSPYNRAIGLGTGHWALRTSLIAAKSSDPAVVFGSLTYTHNFEENITGVGDVKPGDSVGYSAGLAIALSYQTAVSFSFDHTLAEKLVVAGADIDGSFLNSANVKIGANWAINEKSSVDFGVSFGVTEDAPDVTVEVRFPYTF